MDQHAADRRSHYRIKDEVVFQYRRIPETSCERLIERLSDDLPNAFSIKARFEALSQRMIPVLKQIEASAPAVARYLCLFDQKLELLAESLMKNELGNTLDADPVEVDISAGGIAFGTDVPLEPGTLLELRLLLLPSLVGIQAYGRVVYCKPDGGAASHRVGVRYECILEEDRDLIARHVLHRDAERLRQRRCTTD